MGLSYFIDATELVMENPDEAADRDTSYPQEPSARSGLTRPARLEITKGTADVPFAAFRGGADAGVFIHALYEYADFEPAREDPEAAEAAEAAKQKLHRNAEKKATLSNKSSYQAKINSRNFKIPKNRKKIFTSRIQKATTVGQVLKAYNNAQKELPNKQLKT